MRTLCSILMLCSLALAQGGAGGKGGFGGKGGIGGGAASGASISQVNAPVAIGCASASSCALTITATGTGHLVAVAVYYFNGSSQNSTSVTSAGNTFAQDFCEANVSGHASLCSYSTCNSVSGDTTLTANFPTAGEAVVISGEYTHPTTVSCFDQNGGNPTGQNSPFTSFATGTTTQAAELLWGFILDVSTLTATFTGTNGWTAQARAIDGAGEYNFGVLTQIVSSTGAYTLTGTVSVPTDAVYPTLATYK